MTDHCKGCFSDTQNFCSYSEYNTYSECPCSKCVIKVMCNRPCDKFKGFQEYNCTNTDIKF